jgi:hypothetical protein
MQNEPLAALFTSWNLKTDCHCWPLKSYHVGALKCLVLQGSISSLVIVAHYTMVVPLILGLVPVGATMQPTPAPLTEAEITALVAMRLRR